MRLHHIKKLFDAEPAKDAPRHLPTLDGARAVAALMVLVSHSANAGLLPGVLGKGAGQMGVVLFFVLSGFLMAYLHADRAFDRAEVERYARHRVGRVVPLYLAVVLISYLLFQRYENVIVFEIANNEDLARHLFLIRGDHTLWTIPVEIHFYIVFVLLWYLNSRRRALVGVATIAAVLLVLMVLAKLSSALYGYLPYWGHFFLFGFCIGLLWRRHYRRVTEWLSLHRFGMRWVAFAVIVAMVLSLPAIRADRGIYTPPNWCDPLAGGVPVLFFLCALVGIGPFRWLCAKPLRYLGGISYGIYIVQYPVLMSLTRVFTPTSKLEAFGLFALIVTLVITISAISFRFFERPLQDIVNGKKRITSDAGAISP